MITNVKVLSHISDYPISSLANACCNSLAIALPQLRNNLFRLDDLRTMNAQRTVSYTSVLSSTQVCREQRSE